MNINELITDSTSASTKTSRRTAFGNKSYLNLGSKGQEVSGTITSMTGGITLDFNGCSVKLPSGSIDSASEGQTRKFRIMQVSKDSVVLKSTDSASETTAAKPMVSTVVNSSATDFEDILKDAYKVSETKAQQQSNITVLSGDDARALDDEGTPLEEYYDDSFDRAVERIKQQKAYQTQQSEIHSENVKEHEESLDQMQAAGFTDEKSQERIANELRNNNLPANSDLVYKVGCALDMSSSARNMTDQAKAYIVSNGYEPTIDNIYHGMYSGIKVDDVSSCDENAWNEITPQVTEIVNEMYGSGSDISGEYSTASQTSDVSTAMSNAKWLFANELPITVQSLKALDTLNDISNNYSISGTMNQIIQTVSAGAQPQDASLDTSEFVFAKSVLDTVNRIGDSDIISAVAIAGTDSASKININLFKNMFANSSSDKIAISASLEIQSDTSVSSTAFGFKQSASYTNSQADAQADSANQLISNGNIIPSYITSDMSQTDITAVTVKRQIVEIQLKMTLQSVSVMTSKGIDVDTTGLENIVNELRNQEREYFSKMISANISDTDESLLNETVNKTTDISKAPASILGMSTRQMSLITFNELHASAISATVQMGNIMTDYEAVSTQVRTDLGDSIYKAFGNVSQLLTMAGVEDTEDNQRAVRILAYNNMDITSENITSVKNFDEKVNKMIANMKPSSVVKLIRDGLNPLDMTVDEINEKLDSYNSTGASDEKYSKYLWQLERDGKITDNEKESYIGIYRLINNVSVMENAAVGTVLDMGLTPTLGNLLNASKTRKNKSMDVSIDDEFGGLEAVKYMRSPIDKQISSAYNSNSVQDTSKTTNSADTTDLNGVVSSNNNTLENNLGVNSNKISDKSQKKIDTSESAIKNEYYSSLMSDILSEVTPAKLYQIAGGNAESILELPIEQLASGLSAADGNSELLDEYYEQVAQNIREIVQNDANEVKYLSQYAIPTTINNIASAKLVCSGNYDTVNEAWKRKNNIEDEEDDSQSIIDTAVDSLDDETSAAEYSDRLNKYMEKILDKSYKQDNISSEDMTVLKNLSRGISFTSLLSNKHSYTIPVQNGDSVTGMNVTIYTNSEDVGNVSIKLSDTGNGSICANFKVENDAVRGLILCDNRSGYDMLSSSDNELKEAIENTGINVKDISYGMDYRTMIEMDTQSHAQDKTSTRQLYTFAKTVVENIIKINLSNSDNVPI